MTATPPTICAYCGTEQGPFQDEHVVPRCLWDGNRPAHMVTVPACASCNAEYGRDEEYFRTVLVAMAGVGGHPEVDRLLAGKVKRGLDRNARLRADLTKGARPLPWLTPGGLFGGWGLGFQLDTARFYKGVEKTVRGLFFHKSGRPLAPDTRVCVFEGNGFWQTPAFGELLAAMTEPAGVGDDVFSCRCVRHAPDPEWTAWLFVYYQALGFFAWTERAARSEGAA